MDWIRVFTELVAFGTLAIGGLVWLRSSLVRSRHEELEKLADTRGERITDLEKRVDDQTAHINRLEGKVDAALALKQEQIAEGVVEILIPFLEERLG